MDHQIQHYADVHRAEGEAGGPHGLDELRPFQVGAAAASAGLKRSTCPTWSTTFLRRAISTNSSASATVAAERLFHQQVRARFEKIDRHAMMRHGWRGDDRSIDLADQRLVRCEGGSLQLSGQAIAIGGQRINNADKLHAFHSAKLLRMKSAEATRTNDSDAKGHNSTGK